MPRYSSPGSHWGCGYTPPSNRPFFLLRRTKVAYGCARAPFTTYGQGFIFSRGMEEESRTACELKQGGRMQLAILPSTEAHVRLFRHLGLGSGSGNAFASNPEPAPQAMGLEPLKLTVRLFVLPKPLNTPSYN